MMIQANTIETKVDCVAATKAGAVRVVVSGPLVLSTKPLLQAVLNAALDNGARRIAVDLQEVTDLDTAGLATLVVTARRLRACGGTLTFLSLSPTCQDLMDRLHIFETERLA